MLHFLQTQSFYALDHSEYLVVRLNLSQNGVGRVMVRCDAQKFGAILGMSGNFSLTLTYIQR